MAQPSITGISPSSGPTGGGTAVTIQGSGFSGATSVLFGGASATGISVQGDGVIVATSPGGAGTVNISVATPGGSSAIVDASQFVYSTPTSSSTGGSTFVDPGLTNQLVNNLVSVLNSATSPDAIEAQNIIMRRIALEGDVVGSRVPPPRNITEIGGYLNLLGTLDEDAMREQALAGILSVAGANPPLGWISNLQALAMVDVTNDRPDGAWQPTIPLYVLVRSDFVPAVKAAQANVHGYGATMPFSSASVLTLPLATPGSTPPTNALKYIGRELSLAPAAALVAPKTDPLALIRAQGTTDPFEIAANVLTATSETVTPANYDAVECTPTSSTTVTVTGGSFVPLAPILADAGFYPASPLPVPGNSADTTWTKFTNITGLAAGETHLGDELSLLYNAEVIASSVFAGAVDWVWDGTAFTGS
jgi:hypothetical protein